MDVFLITAEKKAGNNNNNRSIVKVIACGGENGKDGYLDTCEVYDHKKNTWSNVASLGSKRSAFRAAMLLDGRVLMTGGGNFENIVVL